MFHNDIVLKKQIVFILIYEGKVKSSSLAYNRRETRDKQPLVRDPGRSWCHFHNSVKLFWSQSMAHGHLRQHKSVLSLSS